MTPERFRYLRKTKLKLSAAEMGIALGYTGPRANVGATIRTLEGGSREIPERVARLMVMFELFGVPEDLEKRAAK